MLDVNENRPPSGGPLRCVLRIVPKLPVRPVVNHSREPGPPAICVALSGRGYAIRVLTGQIRGSEEWLIFYYGDYNTASGNNNAYKRIPVAQYGHNGVMLAQYPSATQAALILNCNPSDIYRACKEKGLSHGFRWRFLSDEIKSLPAYEPIKRGVNTKSVIQLTKSGEFVAEYPSLKAASECTGINNGTISAVCRGKEKHKYAGLDSIDPIFYSQLLPRHSANPKTTMKS